MLRYYQRVNKSEEFKFGSKPIEFDENPLLEGPCFLCISANYEARIGDAPKSNFGASKLGMQIARLRTSDKINAKYGLKDFPVKFLTLQLDTSNEQDRTLEEARKERKNLSIPRTEDLVNRSFFPLISKDGKKIDCKQAMKNLRNVNILVFCDGMLLLQDIEKMMIEKMKELCYSEAECAQILSQMCIFPLGTNRIDSEQKSTCISFLDINDGVVNDQVTSDMKETVLASPIHEAFFQYSDRGMSYLYCGDGSHKFKKYAEDGKALPACLTSIIYRALQNSIRNSKSEDFVPISIEVLTQDIPQIMQEAKDGKNLSEIMKEIDEKIEYEGAKRLSDVEIEQLKKEEATFKKPKPISMESLVANALTQNQVRDAQVLQSQASHFYDAKDNKWFYSPKEI